MFDRILFIFFA